MVMNQGSISRRNVVFGAALTAVGGALAACAPGGSSSSNTSQAAASVKTTVGSEPISLTLYDGQGLKAMDEALIAAFKAKHPNVTITGTYDPDNVTTQNQPRRLNAATPPDLIRVISVTDGTKNGLLTDLTPYEQAYGWNALPSSQLTQFRVRGGVAGSGALYAKPSGFTMTGLSYNKKLAEQIGMTAKPASVAELTALFAKAKAAGLIGLVVGNKDGAAVMPFQLMANSTMGVKAVSDWVFNASGAKINTAEGVKAAQQLADWQKAGYFPDGVNGLDATATDGQFAANKGVFYAWGNWDATNLDKTMPGNVGFFEFPAFAAGGAVGAMSDAATAFGIPTKSKNKDAAALFLDFLSSDEARQIAVDNSFMPSGATTGSVPTTKSGSVLADVLKAFSTLTTNGGQVPFVQNATAGISNQAWTPESQNLLGGKSTAQQFLDNVQKEYESELKN